MPGNLVVGEQEFVDRHMNDVGIIQLNEICVAIVIGPLAIKFSGRWDRPNNEQPRISYVAIGNWKFAG